MKRFASGNSKTGIAEEATWSGPPSRDPARFRPARQPVAREHDRRARPGRCRGRGRGPEGRRRIRTKPTRPAAPPHRAALPGAAVSRPPPQSRGSGGPQLFPRAAAPARNTAEPGVRGRGRAEGNEHWVGPEPEPETGMGKGLWPGMKSWRGRDVDEDRSRGAGEGDQPWTGMRTRAGLGPGRGPAGDVDEGGGPRTAVRGGDAGEGRGPGHGRDGDRGLTVLLPRGRALALSAPGGRGARARSRTARGPPPQVPQTRHRGHERGALARPPRSILGRPRALSAADPPRSRHPAPPALLCSGSAAPAAENGVSASLPRLGAPAPQCRGPPVTSPTRRRGAGRGRETEVPAQRGALRTREKGALGRGAAARDRCAPALRSCSPVSGVMFTVGQAPSSRVLCARFTLPGTRKEGFQQPRQRKGS